MVIRNAIPNSPEYDPQTAAQYPPKTQPYLPSCKGGEAVPEYEPSPIAPPSSPVDSVDEYVQTTSNDDKFRPFTLDYDLLTKNDMERPNSPEPSIDYAEEDILNNYLYTIGLSQSSQSSEVDTLSTSLSSSCSSDDEVDFKPRMTTEPIDIPLKNQKN